MKLPHFCLHQVRDLQKKMQHVENDLDITIEKLSSTTTKLDEKDKSFQLAEGEIQVYKGLWRIHKKTQPRKLITRR